MNAGKLDDECGQQSTNHLHCHNNQRARPETLKQPVLRDGVSIPLQYGEDLQRDGE